MVYYQCKVAYQTFGGENDPSGKGTYLVEALSYTEAEERITEALKAYMNGYFDELDIKKVKVYEIVENAALVEFKWYKAKVMIVDFDEEKQKEKRAAVYYYVQAGDLAAAVKALTKALEKMVFPTEIAAVQETPILDIFKFSVPEQTDNEKA